MVFVTTWQAMSLKKTASTTYYVCALVCSKIQWAHPKFWPVQKGNNGSR